MALAPIVNTPGTKPISKLTSILRELEQLAATERGIRVVLFYGSTTWPDHDNDRCGDTMTWSAVWVATGKRLTTEQSRAFGDWLAAAIIARAARFGLNWLIWWGRIYRHQNTNRGHGWAAYGGDNPHHDHVHLEVAPGPYVGPPLAPPSGGGEHPTPTTPGDDDMPSASELFEADVITPPKGMETKTNPKWTLRGYLQLLVTTALGLDKRLDRIEDKLDRLLK